MPVAVIVQFHVPDAESWIVSPFGKLLADPNQDEAKGVEPDPDLPPGPETVRARGKRSRGFYGSLCRR